MTRTISILTAALLCVAAARAQLSCEKPHHDFGRQPQRENLTGSFTIRNDGEAPVFIQSISFKCFCARGGAKKRTLDPGESTTIDFTFETGAFEGAVKKAVEVRYGSGPVRTLQLSIGGIVIPSWRTTTEILDMGAVAPGATIEREVLVEVEDGHEVDVTAESASRTLTITRQGVEGGRGWRFEVVLRVPKGAPAGELRAQFRLRSDDERKPGVTVDVLAFVESDLRVSPRFLAFGGIDPEQEVKRTVVLESASGRPFALVEIRENRYLLVDGKVGAAAKRHELEVVAPKGLPVGSQRGSLIIRTDRDDEPVVRIGYSFRVRKP